MGRRRRIRPLLGVAPVPKEPCRLPLPIRPVSAPAPTGARRNQAKTDRFFTRFSDPPFSFVSQPNHSSKGRLCRNFGRKSRPLVSGPGIGMMSGIPKDSSRRRFLGRRRRIRPLLGVAPVPKEPCRLPLPIPTGLSPCTDRSSPESGENRSIFTRFSDPPFSFVSQPNHSSKV
ncbi:hypothetical protein Prudu_016319 [Prunus dulcis]|uniref:Uncharacterized protein n=1 Tax=Prunus dulcis TaxID=3755 RepID=A0A4Y1RLA0_PRUDU|nr:hypothetical protein Prudu_016319 [Prunus dulcis]